MSTENENVIEKVEGKEAAVDDTVNEVVNDEEFISEFAPAPIKIPNYNKEKELAKREKINAKNKKKKTKKSKKRRKLLRKIVFVLRTIVLFVLLLSVMIVTLSTLLIKTNTTEYSVKNAIRTHESERFVIGKIKNPEKLNMKPSSQRASLSDVLRDNSMITVTYDDIEQAVRKSSFNDFVADVTSRVLRFYIYGDDFKELTAEDISNVLLENVAYIKLVTGIELGESACNDFGKYILKSSALKELKKDSLLKQDAAQFTYMTKVAFSTSSLIIMVVALMLLLVLTVISCSGFSHKMIGAVLMVSGVFLGGAAFLLKPFYYASSTFVKSVVEALASAFKTSSLIYGAVVFAVGLLVILIGHAMADDEYEEDDEDYIDEIEQVETH